MMHEKPVERLGQIWRAISSGQGWILALQKGGFIAYLVTVKNEF